MFRPDPIQLLTSPGVGQYISFSREKVSSDYDENVTPTASRPRGCDAANFRLADPTAPCPSNRVRRSGADSSRTDHHAARGATETPITLLHMLTRMPRRKRQEHQVLNRQCLGQNDSRTLNSNDEVCGRDGRGGGYRAGGNGHLHGLIAICRTCWMHFVSQCFPGGTLRPIFLRLYICVPVAKFFRRKVRGASLLCRGLTVDTLSQRGCSMIASRSPMKVGPLEYTEYLPALDTQK